MTGIYLATPAPEPPPDPPVGITDSQRLAVLTEAVSVCAPSTGQAFLRSLRANHYPLDLTPLIK